MKNKLTLVLLLLCLTKLSFAQESALYIGHPYSSELSVFDTTGGDYTYSSDLALTSDIGGVIGAYGLTFDAVSETYYIIYSSTLEGEEGIRRLGVLDIVSGGISDISFVGSITDIAFVDGVLYGTTGSYYGSYSLVEINTADGSITDLLDHVSSNEGQCIGYDSFTNTLLKFDYTQYTRIDLGTLTETITASTGHPGECQGLVMKNESIAIVTAYDALFEFNTGTATFEFIMDLPDESHALVFGPPSCESPIVTSTITDEYLGADGAINITVSGGVSPYTFDWDTDETGDFDDDEDLTGLGEGTYSVDVKDSFGCVKSETFTIMSFVNLNEELDAAFTVYPNPTENFVTLNKEGEFQYAVYSVNGKLVLNGNAVDQTKISMGNLPSGVYTMVISTEVGNDEIRIVKN